MTPIRIALVDDQLLFRQSLAMLMQGEPDIALVLEADNGDSCLMGLAGLSELPDILLADMEMPGMDGIELSEKLHQLYPSVKLVVLSVHASERLIARMIDQGACGYLTKNCDKAELMTALYSIRSTGYYLNSRVLNAMRNVSRNINISPKNLTGVPVTLSKREKEILHLICKEYNTSEIAKRLYLSPRTVEGHRNNLLQKTGRRNTAGLVLFALKYRLFETAY
ncbi:MAG: response regulator transcription factor [Chitinophagaceae bacterium]|nr:response regulator transcription factor [Chitinophagaceae bacterium]